MTNTRQRAIRLLRIIQAKTEHSGQPVFVSDLLDELGAKENEANAAFLYLADHRLVDTFSIPYTGRISARGIDLLIEIDEVPQAAPTIQPRENPDHEWDAFISHTSEDKEEFVRPLAERLRQLGMHIWYDELSLTVGDSLRRSIDRGLAKSRFGIVVISPRFLEKSWPQKELDGLVAREADGGKIILPVWHKIGANEIRAYSPTLADRVAVVTAKGLEHVVQELIKAIRQDDAPLAAQPTLRMAHRGSTGPSADVLTFLFSVRDRLGLNRIHELLEARAVRRIHQRGPFSRHGRRPDDQPCRQFHDPPKREAANHFGNARRR